MFSDISERPSRDVLVAKRIADRGDEGIYGAEIAYPKRAAGALFQNSSEAPLDPASVSDGIKHLNRGGWIESVKKSYDDNPLKKKIIMKPELRAAFYIRYFLWQDVSKPTATDGRGNKVTSGIAMSRLLESVKQETYFLANQDAERARHELIIGRGGRVSLKGFDELGKNAFSPREVANSEDMQQELEKQDCNYHAFDQRDFALSYRGPIPKEMFRLDNNRLLREGKLVVIGTIGTRPYYFVRIKLSRGTPIDPKVLIVFRTTGAVGPAVEVARREHSKIVTVASPGELERVIEEIIQSGRLARAIMQSPFLPMYATRAAVKGDIVVESEVVYDGFNYLVGHSRNLRGMDAEVSRLREIARRYEEKLRSPDYRFKIAESYQLSMRSALVSAFPGQSFPR
jgi:hypothetical protein